jgi:photosystem II stability/assembly factor-like uncharacterized protein/tRNA U38,U39,U40 pseudouridine synthase TruA
MLRNRRRLAALFALVLLLQFAVPASAFAALETYWAPFTGGSWAGPYDLPNPNPELDDIPVKARANAVDFGDATHGWSVGYYLEPTPLRPLVVSTSNAGGNWTPTTIDEFAGLELRGVAAVGASNVWVVGDNGLILRRGMSDASWTQQAVGLTAQRLNSVAFADATHGWAVGASGTILKTTDGTNWTAVTSPTSNELHSVCVLDATHVWAVGASGTVVYNTGSGWQTVSTTGTLRSVSFVDALHGWAVGDGRAFRVTSDGGATWSTQAAPAPPTEILATPRSVAFSDSNRGVAVGGHEVAWRTVDGGVTWEAEQFPSENGWGGNISLNGVTYAPGDPSTVWAAGGQDPAYRPTNPKAAVIRGTLYFPISYTLTYTAGANGTIGGTSPQTVGSGGSGTQVTAVPNVGYHFVNWSDGSTSNPRTDTSVGANVNVTANFAINTYTLTYAAGPGGTISGTTPQTVNYNGSGTQVTAVASTGYTFSGWSDGIATAARTDTGVTADRSPTANFAINTYTLTYAAGANGTISGTTPQTVNYNGSGTQVTAVANTGYHFVNWSDASTTNPRTDTNVTANRSLTANFAITTYTLTYTAGTGGTITGTTPQTVNYNGSGTAVTAVANTGYHFVNWSDASTTNPRTDTNVTANRSVTANFAINTYQLKYAAGANGTLSGTASQTVNYNGSGTAVTAVPATGYHFTSWSDGGLVATRTDTGVVANLNVTASFAINTYTLTYTAGANGTITGTTPQTVNYNGSGTQVTAVASAGYHFVNWSDGGLTAARTDSNVTAAVNVTANFTADAATYTLTYTAGANGTISGTSPQTVSENGSGTAVTAVANTNYHFVNWSDGSTANPRTDTNVIANRSVTANFAINTYQLKYAAGANGTLSGTTSQTVIYNGSGTAVTAVANTGYHFVSWSDGGLVATRTDTGVTASLNVTASFAINTYQLKYAAGANGTLSGTTSQTVNYNGSGTAVTANANTGYHFVNWSDARTTNPRTDTGVTASLNVTANFAIDAPSYTLTYTAGANGTISGTTPQTVSSGGSGTAVTAVASTGYHFLNWSDASTTNLRTDTNVTSNKSVTANFAINTYQLTYTAGANGTISGTSPQTVNYNGSGTAVTAVPNTGYHFTSWSDASTANPRTDTNVTANKSVTASFAADGTTPSLTPVYRFYNLKMGVHFYTASASEMATVRDTLYRTYRLEGVAYNLNTANPANDTSLYRFYNIKKGVHFYTASEAEKANVIRTLSGTYRYEGVAYRVCATAVAGATPVYRFYNLKQGVHFYTASAAERDTVVRTLWSTYRLEGVGYYLAP